MYVLYDGTQRQRSLFVITAPYSDASMLLERMIFSSLLLISKILCCRHLGKKRPNLEELPCGVVRRAKIRPTVRAVMDIICNGQKIHFETFKLCTNGVHLNQFVLWGLSRVFIPTTVFLALNTGYRSLSSSVTSALLK